MGLSIPHLLVVLVIVILVFGTKRLKNIGADLGEAIKGFRSAVKEGSEDKAIANKEEEPLEGEVTNKEKDRA
ncbi:Sec-independent protein translocase subunit TatA [Methylomonas fluvii]|uniref:Sec-independent protein translocase protein TatA n=1 Tax=Methylomonas fluvii TaxID=1854564 RepID=A0ABR9DA98_9GAMM|nr:Sec-independent protein translocase subunit TatA [Methylomonas fluvii]MBD9359751.1 Sec-independent protein translocase subunit TatA [Methylomonas fluvii]CAD6872506.1 Twin-arginine translocation protein TatA [Methylomonas fluvii]